MCVVRFFEPEKESCVQNVVTLCSVTLQSGFSVEGTHVVGSCFVVRCNLVEFVQELCVCIGTRTNHTHVLKHISSEFCFAWFSCSALNSVY